MRRYVRRYAHRCIPAGGCRIRLSTCWTRRGPWRRRCTRRLPPAYGFIATAKAAEMERSLLRHRKKMGIQSDERRCGRRRFSRQLN
ncbi:hypothetical protein KCP73_06585 [Salmonella enterica subsp. enterica]|nr:hypothetical protein KCP73_06585 [Salmonella enterica subsp. enterica]